MDKTRLFKPSLIKQRNECDNTLLNSSISKQSSLSSTEKRILGLLFKKGPLTQAQLTKRIGLTQQSTSRLISGLLDRNIAIEGKKTASGKRGYPSTTFLLSSDYAYTIGISLMADAVGVSLVNFSGQVVSEKMAGLSSMGINKVIEWLNHSITAMLYELNLDKNSVVGAGVGIAGSHLANQKGYNTPYALEEWAGIDVDETLSKALNIPVWSDNDGNVAALGENMIGVGKWADSFAYLYISSGIGGGIILDGELWRGRYGNAGEFAGGLPPNIYPFPNLELLRQLIARQGVHLDTVYELVQEFDPDWPGIDDWITRVHDSLSIIVSNAIAILDLDAVVLGGSLPKVLSKKIIDNLELFDQKRRGQQRPMGMIVPAEAKGDATALGAAMLPLHKTFFV